MLVLTRAITAEMMNTMKVIHKAGTIILRPGKQELEVLLVYRAQHHDWTFPKGHCEPGESFAETAAREAEEETGLHIELIRSLPDMEYTDSQQKLCKLHMFLAKPIEQQPQLKIEYPGDQLAWTPLSLIEQKLSYENLRDYFASIKDDIK